METRKLGSNFEISAIGLGCMGMTHGFGDASDQKEMIEVIRGAYQAGITMFDTAECYQGVSETGEILYNEDLVGQALSIYPRDSYQMQLCGIKVIDGKQVLDARPEVIRTFIRITETFKTDYVSILFTSCRS
ncbi:MAG: aldo/keto reductase [Thomasclavelia ramosa]